MNKQNSMEKKILNSNFKFTKNFLYFMIVSIVVLIVGVVLSFTVGFNLGTDFTGASSVKVYVNNEASFENVKAYDLNKKEDYDAVYDKVVDVFEDNGLIIVSYRSSTINLMEDYRVPDGQAIEIVFQNSSTNKDKINNENTTLREALIAEFDYSNYESAVTSVDYSPVKSSFNWTMGILAAVVFGLLLTVAYMMFRYDISAWIVLILQVALDILLFISLLAICRIPVNLTVGIAVLSTFVLTIINAFVYYARMKENIKSGKYTGMKNNEMADSNIKEGLFKRIIAYVVMLILALLLVFVAVPGVRNVALAVIIALFVTFFTSTFFTPLVWAVIYKEKKKKIAKN